MKRDINIAVIGAGAAGLMCSCVAAEKGANVTLFEKNKSNKVLESERYFDNAYLGKKLLITGKGRCNVTNACTRDEFLKNVTGNPKFLYAAFNAFPPEKVMEFFAKAGTPLKIERGNRVFPVSDKSLDILRAFKLKLKENNVKVINAEVRSVVKNAEVFEIETNSKKYMFDKVIVCTGGLSYPVTGSTGDGYRIARSFGHTVTDLHASLVPLECVCSQLCSEMSGLSLKNVKLSLIDKSNNKTVFSELGEMLFTHFGISGPLVLSASAHMKGSEPYKYCVQIDLKPALDNKKIDQKLIKLFEEYSNKKLSNVLADMLPKSMITPFCKTLDISPDIRPNSVTKEMRSKLVSAFKAFTLDISQTRPVAEAVVTAGGVKVNEIMPSTMESKLVPGLYFAGEVLDLDAYTGGFNLQIAFSTAYAAAGGATGEA